MKCAKKLEAMHDRRNAGEDDDDDSTVSAISKRHRRRRKKKSAVSLTTITSESNLVSTAKLVKMETEAERQRKQRADKQAKKLEDMIDLRNRNTGEGDDDATTVTGILKRHRQLENQRRLDQRAKKFAARSERFHRGGGGVDESRRRSTVSCIRWERKKRQKQQRRRPSC